MHQQNYLLSIVVLIVVVVIFILWKRENKDEINVINPSKDKVSLSILTASLALVLNSPVVYGITAKMTCGVTADPSSSSPTPIGLLIHNILLAVAVYILL